MGRRSGGEECRQPGREEAASRRRGGGQQEESWAGNGGGVNEDGAARAGASEGRPAGGARGATGRGLVLSENFSEDVVGPGRPARGTLVSTVPTSLA